MAENANNAYDQFNECDTNTTVICDAECAEFSIAPVWGLGNQLYVFAHNAKQDDDRQSSQHSSSSGENRVLHEMKWSTDIHNCYTRKKVNDSHNIFITLQKEQTPETAGVNKKPHLAKVSRHYRSVLKACILDLTSALEATSVSSLEKQYTDQIKLLETIELIWSLCEILFIEVLPDGVIMLQLLDWVRWHSGELSQKRQQMMEESVGDHVEQHPFYWDVVYGLVLQGRIEEAKQLLTSHSQSRSDAYQAIIELLHKMPSFKTHSNMPIAEFSMRWRHWQDECMNSLRMARFMTSEELTIICRILCGEEQVFQDIRQHCGPWYFLLVSKLLYQNPVFDSVFDLEKYAQSCLDVIRLSPLDGILLAAFQFDVAQVIKESSAHLSNWWFVAHLTDLLHHCGLLETQRLSCNNFGSNFREYLLLEYASSLMTHESLWQIGADYFDYCPEYGRQYLEQYVEHIPVTTEKKALKLIHLCEKREMHDQVRSICKVMGMKALGNKRLGSALSWCLRSKDVSFATYLSQKFLDEYSEKGGFHDLDLIDNLGSAMLLSNRLTFLGKYREFHRLYEEGDLAGAGSLLLSLLTAKLAPKRFWLTLLTDALPLLQTKEVLLNSQQTYELMQCLEELLQQQKSEKSNVVKSKGQIEMEKEKLDLMKLALARNLARAILQEGNIQVMENKAVK
ncbi:nuclear pore complex protein Nup85-like [Tubulanus polymorphus]|uniref:nuclear pore complex protein Nup85-like n=1 Tax=Tubulanus polymorphus TaxID=672921 RepID=UPI003DA43055